MKKYQRQEGQSTVGAIVGVVVVIALLAGLVFGGWALGWWFRGENANREAHVIRQGYSNQQTLREEVTRKIGDVQTISVQIAQLGSTDLTTTQPLHAQRKAIVNIVCKDAEQITGDPLPTDQDQFVTANCKLGSISPDSQYN